MLGAVKKRAESDFSANRPYSLTITVLTVSENYFLHFDRDFYIYNIYINIYIYLYIIFIILNFLKC